MPKRKSAEALQIEMFRRMTPQEKLDLAERLRRTNLDLLEAGIRSREGDLPPAKMRLRVLERILPRELFLKVYGDQNDG